LPTSSVPGESYTRLSGRALLIARLAWLGVAILAVVVFVAKIVKVYTLLTHPSPVAQALLAQLGISPTFRAAFTAGVEALLALVFFTVAIALVRLRPDLLPALLASAAFVAFGASGVTLNVLAQADPRWVLPVTVLGFIYRIAFIIFMYVFPDGRFIPRWTKGLAVLWAMTTLLAALPPDFPLSASHWPPLVGLASELALFGTVVYSQVHRYRRVSSASQRRQTRWVAFGITMAIGLAFVAEAPRYILPSLSRPTVAGVRYELIFAGVWDLSLALIPITVGIAILRYRLYDIDIIIRRTLVYVPLTAIIAGLFAMAISLAQKVFLALTGQHSDAAAVLATLIVVAAFDPIRQALKTAVDKRFLDVPDPAKKLDAFGEQVRTRLHRIDPAPSIRRLLEEGVAAFEATCGAAYLERDGKLALLQAIGEWQGDARLSVMIETEQTRWGQVQLGARLSGHAYTDKDREVLLQAAQIVAAALAQDQGAA
jgi:hypothetical protein